MRLTTLKNDLPMLDGRTIKTKSSWQRSKQLSRHERGYGYAWEKLRKTILLRDSYLCQVCLRNGKPEPAKQVDHIVPKSYGGTDDPENLQSICEPCHKAKSIMESVGGYLPGIDGGGLGVEAEKNLHGTYIFSGGSKGGVYMPDWLPKPGIPVRVICGPPASGKSTYVKNRADEKDLVLDLDEISARLSGKQIYTTNMDDTRRAIRYRNGMLAGLGSRATPYPLCWLIVTGRTRRQREWWADKMGSVPLVLDTPPALCKDRILKDGRRPEAVKTRHLEIVETFEYD